MQVFPSIAVHLYRRCCSAEPFGENSSPQVSRLRALRLCCAYLQSRCRVVQSYREHEANAAAVIAALRAADVQLVSPP